MTEIKLDGLRARLVVYAPDGLRLGALPQPLDWEAAAPLNDLPSMTLSYMAASPGADLLNSPCEVALEIAGSTAAPTLSDDLYAEYPSSRFMNLRRAWDALDRAQVRKYTLPGYGWQLRKVRFADVSKINDEGRIPFTGATVGKILRSIITESKARGNVPGLVYKFTDTVDSAGVPWPTTFDIEFNPGQDAWSILDAFTRQGQCDWRVHCGRRSTGTGTSPDDYTRELQVYVADTVMRRDLTSNTSLLIAPWSSTEEAPAETTIEDMAARLVVVGDKRNVVAIDSPSTSAPWGKWEEVMTAGGVTDPTALTVLAQRTLSVRSQERTQMTTQALRRPGNHAPMATLLPGDVVHGYNSVTGDQLDEVRIFQVTMRLANDHSMEYAYVLNDRFMDRLQKYERWVNTLTGTGGPGGGGASGAGGGGIEPSPSDPSPESVIGGIPLAPTGLAVTASSYIDAVGNPVGLGTATFNPVTQDENGKPVTVSWYRLGWRRTDLQPGVDSSSTISAPSTTIYADKLEGGRDYRFTVEAISSTGQTSQRSPEVIVHIPLSTVPPPKPPLPVLSTKLGTVKVTWDGTWDAGASTPADFSMMRVFQAPAAAGPFTAIGEIYQAGSSVVASNLTVGSTYYFRFLAVNTSGVNSVTPGNTASIVALGVTAPDIEANAVTANSIAAGSITAEKVQAYSLSVDRLTVGGSTNLIADPLMANSVLWGVRLGAANTGPNTDTTELAWRQTVATPQDFEVYAKTAVTATRTARIPLHNNTTFGAPNLFANTTVDPGLLVQVGRARGQTSAGKVKLRVTVTVSQGDTAWGAGASVRVRWKVAEVVRTGGRQNYQIMERTISAPGTVVVETTDLFGGGDALDAATVAILPFLEVLFDNVPANCTARFDNPECWQEGSVYIGEGMIQAPLIAANAITTNELSANAITAKHTITSALFQTNLPGISPRIEIGPNVNFLNQAGMLLTPSSGVQPSRFFVSDAAGSGGWEPNSFVICGPEVVINSSGRSDLVLGTGGDMKLSKMYVDTNNLFAGIDSVNESNELNLNGSVPVGYKQYDTYSIFRVYEKWWPGTAIWTYTWPVNNGSWYKGFATLDSEGASFAMVSLDCNSSNASFKFRISAAPRLIRLVFFRGGSGI